MGNILLGVGNLMRADDGIGCYIAKKFKHKGWKSIDTGTMPENFTSLVRKESPKFVVIVDSTEMGLKSGEFRIIPKEKLSKLMLTTHAMPLSVLISYLEEFVPEVIFIGIQPKIIENKEEINPQLLVSAKNIIQILKNNQIEKIKLLENIK